MKGNEMMPRDKIPETQRSDIHKALAQLEDRMIDVALIVINFRDRMSLGMAEERFNIPKGELRGAIERGEIETYRMSETRYQVSAEQVAAWIEQYKCHRNAPLPS